MRAVWQIARTDLLRWRRAPVIVAATLVPALGMGLMVMGLTYAVGRQPVALVAESEGPIASRLINIIRESDGFFLVERDADDAARDLRTQAVAGVITIPRGFEERVGTHDATVSVLVNNVNQDFADDIRRAVAQAVVEIDAPSLAELGESGQEPGTVSGLPNPYRIDFAATDLRTPDIGFLRYQLVPVLALLALTGGATVTALALTGDKESGALQLVTMTPVPRSSIVLGRIAGGVSASSLLLLAIVVPARLLGILVPPPGRWPAVAALLGLMSISAVALGSVVGLLCRRVATAVMLSVNVATSLFLLGGGFTTFAFLPSIAQRVARSLPTYYAVEGIREALFYESTRGLGRNVAVLAAFTGGSIFVGSLVLAREARRS